MLRISRKLMFKGKSIYDEKCGNNVATKDAFIASNGWHVKFLFHNNFSTKEDENTTNTSVPFCG